MAKSCALLYLELGRPAASHASAVDLNCILLDYQWKVKGPLLFWLHNQGEGGAYLEEDQRLLSLLPSGSTTENQKILLLEQKVRHHDFIRL